MNQKRKNYISDVCIFLLCSFLVVSLGTGIRNDRLQLIGIVSSLLTVITTLCIFFRGKLKVTDTLKILVVYIVYNLFILIRSFTLQSVYFVLQQVVLMFFAYFLSNIKLTQVCIKKICSFLGNVYCVILSIFILFYFSGNFVIIKTNINSTMYKFLFVGSFFTFIKVKHKFLFSVVVSMMLFIWGERTSAVLMILVYISFVGVKYVKNKCTYRVLFVIFMLGTIFIPNIYLGIYQNTNIMKDINSYSRMISSENFFSGREKIWDIILTEVEGSEIFGLTYDNNILASYGISLSTHNLYLWLIINGGYILIFILVCYIYTFWNKYYVDLENDIVRASSSYLLSFIVLCSFELLWIVNNFTISIIMWIVINLGVISCNNCKALQKDDTIKN